MCHRLQAWTEAQRELIPSAPFSLVLNAFPLHFYYICRFSIDQSSRNLLKNMVGLGRVELPTRGLGKQGTLLTRSENFGLYYTLQPVTRLRN